MSAMAATEHPDVPTHAEWSSRSKVWVLTLLCPYCGRVHMHGGGDGLEPDFGFRVPHCLEGDFPSYRLISGPLDMPKPLPCRRRASGPMWQNLPVGTRVRPKRGFKCGTVERVVESRADGMTLTVAVCWDSGRHAQQWATDCLVRIADQGDIDE